MKIQRKLRPKGREALDKKMDWLERKIGQHIKENEKAMVIRLTI